MNKNNCETETKFKPNPKYKKGDLIELKSGRIGRICYEPKWNDWSKWQGVKPQWYYDYDYYTHSALGSEGSVLECDISCKLDKKEKEFGNIEKNNETELNKIDREHDERNYITKSSKIDALEETMWWASSDEDGKY